MNLHFDLELCMTLCLIMMHWSPYDIWHSKHVAIHMESNCTTDTSEHWHWHWLQKVEQYIRHCLDKIQTGTCTHMHACIHTHIHTHKHTHIHTHSNIHTPIQTYTHTHTHSNIHTHIQTYTHTHTHTCMRAHIRTHTQWFQCNPLMPAQITGDLRLCLDFFCLGRTILVSVGSVSVTGTLEAGCCSCVLPVHMTTTTQITPCPHDNHNSNYSLSTRQPQIKLLPVHMTTTN